MIIFKNAGLIDLRAVKTMGVSVKSDNAIGYFGTGLKYAIAVLLREGQEITIYRGGDAFKFDTKQEEIRGETFNIVCMNGEELGFTDQLGKNWELWHAFREIYSNCKDEDGITEKGNPDLKVNIGSDYTTIIVKGDKFVKVYDNKELYFIEGKADIETEFCDIHLKPSSCIFYKGVNVSKQSACFTYNLKKTINLTEDRTAAYNFQIRRLVSQGVATCTDKSFIKKILVASNLNFEGKLDFDNNEVNPSKEFIEVCRDLSDNFTPNTNKDAIRYAKKHSDIGDAIKDIDLTDLQNNMLKRAKTLLDKGGYSIEGFPIRCVETLGMMVHGQAVEGTIIITQEAFNQGTKELAITLLEEFWHLKHGFHDETRAFQNHLFSQVGTLIERINGEAF